MVGGIPARLDRKDTLVTLQESPTTGAALDAPLHALIRLGLLAKHAHWNVHGPAFGSLHALLDDVAAVARSGADAVAERAVTLRHAADGRPSVVAADGGPDLPAGPMTDVEVIEAFDRILTSVVNRLRDALEAYAGDVVTEDILTGTTGELEKLAWMIRAHR